MHDVIMQDGRDAGRAGVFALDGRLHVEPYMFDVARLVEEDQAIGEAFDMGFRKNEAMIGRGPGNSSMFVEFEEGCGVFEIATLALGADGLDFAKRVQGLLKLAGEPLGVHAEGGQLRDEGLGVGESRSASRIGMRLRRQAVSASS